MDRESITELSDVNGDYVKVDTTIDSFYVPLHIGIKISHWLDLNSEYANQKHILKMARKWKMSDQFAQAQENQ